jgi:hypothetical protein
MTSRPLNVTIKNKQFKIYYVDYLCVDNFFRKKNIAQQMIQTHEYNQRNLNKSIKISLFKREEQLTGIVPLCVYKTFGYNIMQWQKPFESPVYPVIEATQSNISSVLDFIEKSKCESKFDICIFPEIFNFIELLKKNIMVYYIVKDHQILAVYFFRKTCTFIKKNVEVISCFASINNTSNGIFADGYKTAIFKIFEKNPTLSFATIENISDNDMIVKMVGKPLIESPTAYFFYNYVCATIQPKKAFIVS